MRTEPQQLLASVDLNKLIGQVVDLTRARWSDLPQQRGIVIDVQTDLATDLPAIQGIESEIRDTLTNLLFNAVDAMPDGGTLSPRTIVVSGDVRVEVRDAGVGMDEDTRRRCVEPFFTTKGERGTGLWLASVDGMVERHSGSLEIESEPGKGTTVRLGNSSAVLCLWLLASATHFHAPDRYAHSHQGVHHVCGFCASLSAAGAAPSNVIFRSTVHPQEHSAAADDAQIFARLAPASYRSRAPPAA